MNKDLVLSLQTELEKSQHRIIELEEQLRWQELENQNQLSLKEAKINALKRVLNFGGVGGGGAEADLRLYERRNSQPNSSSSISTSSNTSTNASLMKPSLVPLELRMSQTSSSSSGSSSENAKIVFRHHLQRQKSLSTATQYPTLEGASTRPKPWSISPKMTVITPAALPEDFKATVATLPPIELKRSKSTAEVNIHTLAIDNDFGKSKLTKKNVLSNL